jgi:tripartite-type tricarboxylate transporter receptor subunit TctC
MRLSKFLGPAMLACVMFLNNAFAAGASSARDFYKNNTVRLIVSAAAGGGYDLYARVIARHLSEHLGANIIVENMGEAAGLNAANFVFNQAPRDGTVIGSLRETLAFNQLIQPQGIRYDAKDFDWIGSMAPANTVIFLYGPKSPVQNLEEAEKTQVVMGAQGRADEGYIQTKAMNALVGTKFKIVLGYSGIPAVDLAIRRGEVNGRQGEWTAVKNAHPDWVREHKLIFLAQVSVDKISDLPQVPRLIDLAKKGDDRKIASLVSAPSSLGRVIAAPPGVPAERVAFLRAAFDATMSDPKFRADAARLKLDVEPQSGQVLQKEVANSLDVQDQLIKRAKAIFQ